MFLEQIYVFLSNSTGRWKKLKKKIEEVVIIKFNLKNYLQQDQHKEMHAKLLEKIQIFEIR